MQLQDYTTDATLTVSSLFQHGLRQTFRFQRTIAESVAVRGFGFWTGEDVNVEFRPAPPNSGVVFVRVDLPEHPRIPALVEYRDEKPRQTSLVNGNARVDMVEHLLAAVRAHHIDNCEIHVNRPEMPGFDGSSYIFFRALETVHAVEQPNIRPIRLVTRSFRVGTSEHWISVLPSRNGKNMYHYSLVADTGYPLEDQGYAFDFSTDSFREEIMSTRTFISKPEADYLLDQGLCKRVTARDVIVLDAGGPIDNSFRFQNECARHKILDMVGDFSLTPCDWIGTFESYRGSHALNAECVRQLLENSLLFDESFFSDASEPAVKRAA